mgnify:CR=1 FL=1
MSSKEGQTVIEFRDVVRTYGEGEDRKSTRLNSSHTPNLV